jgi:uncharacterized protein YdhG (YjbR/CyaY superfamily)
MNEIKEYLELNDKDNKLKNIYSYILKEYPELELIMKWDNPVLIIHNTFIMSIVLNNEDIVVSIEETALNSFREEFKDKYRLNRWLLKTDKELELKDINKMIDYKLIEKKDYNTYWKNDSKRLIKNTLLT